MSRLPITLALIAIAAGLCGCSGPHVTIREGDANSVQISYSQDVEPTQALARGYCLRYEKAPVFSSADGQIATYNCVPLQQRPAAR